LIEPNDDRVEGKKDHKNMPFRSLYWEVGSPKDTCLRSGGYEEFPILAPRWDVTTSADVYGRGPGWDGLGDVKMLQKMQKQKLVALDKMVDPPIQRDASVQGEVNTLPGGITYSSATSPNAGVRPAYQVQPDLNSLEFSIEKTSRAIEKTFYSDLFLMLAQGDQRAMTAREVIERHEEKLLALSPVIDRLESELLDPLIDRTFAIAMRAGLIPPPPAELQGTDLKVEYVSMLAQAQKMVGTTAIEQAMRFIGSLISVSPEIVDMVDFGEAIQKYCEMLGIPPKVVKAPEIVAQVRAQRAQAQQAAQQAQAKQNMIQGAQTMSQTPVGQNSALDVLMGGNGAQQ